MCQPTYRVSEPTYEKVGRETLCVVRAQQEYSARAYGVYRIDAHRCCRFLQFQEIFVPSELSKSGYTRPPPSLLRGNAPADLTPAIWVDSTRPKSPRICIYILCHVMLHLWQTRENPLTSPPPKIALVALTLQSSMSACSTGSSDTRRLAW